MPRNSCAAHASNACASIHSRCTICRHEGTVVVDYYMSATARGRPSVRSCDLAYIAILKILGEKDDFAEDRKHMSERDTFDATQKELWEKWDKAIDALKVKIAKK